MGAETAAMAPTQQRASQRSRIERSLSLTIESKDVRTRMQYGAQLDAMFPKLPRELSFEAFKEQMQRFGFVDQKELSDTFKRFASYSGKMQFRDFAYALPPPDKLPMCNVQPTTTSGERRPHEAETSHDVWDLGLGATNMSICSSVDLGATGRTAGRATQLKSRMKKRRAASAGFGRKITYITNPKILDMESTRSELAPADNLFRTGASHQYETTNMMYSKHWDDEQSYCWSKQVEWCWRSGSGSFLSLLGSDSLVSVNVEEALHFLVNPMLSQVRALKDIIVFYHVAY